MVTPFLIVVILHVFSIISVIIFSIINHVFVIIIVWLQPSFSIMLPRVILQLPLVNLSSKPSLSFPHFIEPLISSLLPLLLLSWHNVVLVIIENLVLVIPLMCMLHLGYLVLLLLATLLLLQVVQIQFIFQEVNIGVLLHIDVIVPLQFLLQSLILLLVLRLHILNTLQSLLSSVQLHLPPLYLVIQFSLVLTKLLHRVLHLIHLTSLLVYYITNTLFYVDLLIVRVKIP